MNNYLHLRTFLKYQAEECAGSAALYYDEVAYSNGLMVISEQEALSFIEKNITEISASPMIPLGSQLTFEMEIEDDEKGYLNGENIPSVTVTLNLDTPDLFRLAFLKVTRVTRQAKYELS